MQQACAGLWGLIVLSCQNLGSEAWLLWWLMQAQQSSGSWC